MSETDTNRQAEREQSASGAVEGEGRPDEREEGGRDDFVREMEEAPDRDPDDPGLKDLKGG